MDTTLSDPLVGRVLDGRYRIEARLARGGMASVYSATDTRLDRQVAVKVMHAALADDADFVARFIREAKAAARLSHPNVVSVYDQGADGDVVFLVMEHVAGHTLRHVLRERGKLPVGSALAILEPVLAALAAAHDAGLVHRDIKPENVLLAADGRVKVADFGLARAVAGTTLTGTGSVLMGTVAYLAPEQVTSGAADARTDVYAAGLVLFEMLTGKPAFQGETPVSVAYRHVQEDVPAPSSLVRSLPAQVDRLVTTAAARDPARRPADAGAFLVAVAAVRDELGCTDGVPRLAAPVWPPTTLVGSGDEATTAFGSGTRVLRPESAPTAPVLRAGSRRRWPFVVVPLVVIAALAGLLGWWLGSTGYVRTPAVVGLSETAARQLLGHDGLHLRLGPAVYSDTVPVGDVAAQSPPAHAKVRSHGTVVLALSRGVHLVVVPRVSGDTVPTATAALAQLTLTVSGTRPQYSATVARGLVIGTLPAAGQTIRHGSGVELLISQGPAPIKVPTVVNMPVAAATRELSSAGFKVIEAPQQVYSNQIPAGNVAAQTPNGGALAARGSTVTITVSQGPQLFPVPNEVGRNVSSAVRDLQRHGFIPAVQQLAGGNGQQVVAQNPQGGTQIPQGSTVTLYTF